MLIAVTVSIDHRQLPTVFDFLNTLEGASVKVNEVKEVPQPAVEKVATPAAPVAPVSVFTEEDVANATRSLAQAKGIDAATALLKEFNIEKARNLAPEQREAFIMRAKKIAEVQQA